MTIERATQYKITGYPEGGFIVDVSIGGIDYTYGASSAEQLGKMVALDLPKTAVQIEVFPKTMSEADILYFQRGLVFGSKYGY